MALVKAAESATDKSSGIKAFLQQSGLQVSFNAARSKYYMLTVPELGGKRAE